MEDKKYEFEGTITLRTQDFLDIFAKSISAQKDREVTESKYYSEMGKSRKLEDDLKTAKENLAAEKAKADRALKDVSALQNELTFLYDFIHSDEAVSALFTTYAKGKAASNA